jgi:hypothetical protein
MTLSVNILTNSYYFAALFKVYYSFLIELVKSSKSAAKAAFLKSKNIAVIYYGYHAPVECTQWSFVVHPAFLSQRCQLQASSSFAMLSNRKINSQGWKHFIVLLIFLLREAQSFCFLRPVGFRWSLSISLSDSMVETSVSNTRDADDPFISGLLPPKDFERLTRIDRALHNLQYQLDTLLTKPLSENDAEPLYEQDFQLLGPSREVLASSRQELITLSSTLVLASAATRQASRFVSSLARREAIEDASHRDGFSETNRIEYQIIAENTTDWNRIVVLWKTNITSMAALASAPVTLEGLSLLEFNSDTTKIARHLLFDVTLNEQPLNAIGEVLATLRAAVRSVSQAPWLPSAATASASPFSFLNELRNSLLERAVDGSASSTTASSVGLPLYFVHSLDSFLNDTTALDRRQRWNFTNAEDDTSQPSGLSGMLPGTLRWKRYASAHQILSVFIEESIPKLSSVNSSASREDFRNLFAPQAQMVAMDNRTQLINGGIRLADFYRTISSLRRNAKSTWALQDARVDDWIDRRVRIQYVATISNPLKGTPTKIQGTDVFVLEDGSGRIQRVEQVELKVDGNPVTDPGWYQRLISSLDATTTGGADWWMDLWQQATVGSTPSSSSRPSVFEEKAAATVYNIMVNLHSQIANLVSSGKGVVPMTDFLTAEVELRGYLGEVLLRGKSVYLQLLRIAFASLNGLIATGRVSWVKAPYASSVELTAQGTIKCSMILPLQINSLNENIGLPTVPLNLELVSEYKMDERTGYIIEHRLIESRVNGQLTPADVIPRWIKQWSSSNYNLNWRAPSFDGGSVTESTVQALMEALWSLVQRPSRGK